MAAVDTWNLSAGKTPRLGLKSTPVPPQVEAAVADLVRDSFKREAWRWFRDHEADEILTVNFWIFRKTITLGDLHPVWERVFGPEPL